MTYRHPLTEGFEVGDEVILTGPRVGDYWEGVQGIVIGFEDGRWINVKYTACGPVNPNARNQFQEKSIGLTGGWDNTSLQLLAPAGPPLLDVWN